MLMRTCRPGCHLLHTPTGPGGFPVTTSPSPVLPDRLLSGVARLAAGHAGRFSTETVQHLLAETSRVHVHLVVPAERLTAERLDALAHAEDQAGSAHPGCCSCAAATRGVPRWPRPY
ncbi:hypothetical protein [Microbispora sp. H10670]|uniref:hypothetical protein n=1 Tax=Microbispora sp. H10670 TaxID=2729108 RepID=UPI0037C8CA85